MKRNFFDTLAEAIEDIEDREGEHDVVLLPPANDPYASDEEVGDDDIGFAGNLDLPADVAGAVEIHVAESSKVRTLALRHIVLFHKHLCKSHKTIL